MGFLGFIIAIVASWIISQIFKPKKPSRTPEKFNAPRAEEGEVIPVAFGTVEIAQNIVFYSDLQEVLGGQGRTHYYGRMHGVLCHGPVDALIDIRFGDHSIRFAKRSKLRNFILGSSSNAVLSVPLPATRAAQTPTDEHLEEYVYAPDLYGGPEKQGGVFGLVHLHWGVLNDVVCELTNYVFGPSRASAFPGLCYVTLGWADAPVLSSPSGPFLSSLGWVWHRPCVYGSFTTMTGSFFAYGGSYLDLQVLGSVRIGMVGCIEIYKTFAGLTPGQSYTIAADFDVWGCRATPNCRGSVSVLGMSATGATSVAAFLVWPLRQNHLVMTVVADSNGEVLFKLGEYNYNWGDPAYAVRITNFTFGGSGAQAFQENYLGPYLTNDGLFYFGSNNPIPRPTTWIIKRQSVGIDGRGVGPNNTNAVDMIFEILTVDQWGLGISPSLIDATNFANVAGVLLDEGLGLSLLLGEDREADDVIGDILQHIDGVLFMNPLTGLVQLKLVREDYTVLSTPPVDESNAVDLTRERQDWTELTNEVKVKYKRLVGTQIGTTANQLVALNPKPQWFFFSQLYSLGATYVSNVSFRQGAGAQSGGGTLLVAGTDYVLDATAGRVRFIAGTNFVFGSPVYVTYTSAPTFTGFIEAEVTQQNLAAWQATGEIRSETFDLYMFTDDVNANAAAGRLLRALSQRLAAIRWKMDRHGFDFTPGMVVRVSWARFGMVNVPVRIANIDYGSLDDGQITVEGIEDKYGFGAVVVGNPFPGPQGPIPGPLNVAPPMAGFAILKPSSFDLELYAGDPAFDIQIEGADDENETNAVFTTVAGTTLQWNDPFSIPTTRSYRVRHLATFPGYQDGPWSAWETYTSQAGTVPAPAFVIPTAVAVPTTDPAQTLGTLTVTVTDPQHRLIRFEVQLQQDNLTPSVWQTLAGPSPYVATIQLNPSESSTIRYRVYYYDAQGNPTYFEGAYTWNPQVVPPGPGGGNLCIVLRQNPTEIVYTTTEIVYINC